jgi:hypothetical protein
MTEYFASEEACGDPQETLGIKHRTIVIRFEDAENGDYFPITSKRLQEAFFVHTNAMIEAAGSLNRGFEWHITIKHQADCLELLERNPVIRVIGPEGAYM